MLTAKGRDTDIAKGMALGANDYMLKPFSTKELVQKVRDMLGVLHEKFDPRVALGVAIIGVICLVWLLVTGD